jgi:hypothetical protein
MSQVGLRVSGACGLGLDDIKRDLGRFGKLHVRHGKGARGSGPRERMVPLINGADAQHVQARSRPVRPKVDNDVRFVLLLMYLLGQGQLLRRRCTGDACLPEADDSGHYGDDA